ncbi:CpaF family protein [Saccharopolyspora sp. HNM0986]|uniref:CpaF family protein n=1 Tax=Saccharopolyspora galaxeae TaxID=2781241 RepID=UPI00190C64AC|nr:ATPase, T2SS/T4P/T4SS family [Saccharopolyspora sp. HNM0986]MBK0870211.1 CpaF family protein [Saccharopolyspora sp. HNM0986]
MTTHALPWFDDGDPIPDPATVDALRQRAAARLSRQEHDEQAVVSDVVFAWAAERASAGLPAVADAVERRVIRAVHGALAGLGGIAALLDRDQIENIHIHGHDHVLVETATGTTARWPHPVADSDEALMDTLGEIFARAGRTSREFSPAHPIANVRIPAGGPLGARIAAVRELCDRPKVAIRRHRLAHATLDDLHTNGTLDARLHQFLAATVAAGLNVLVTGGPYAGKTTLLRALCQQVPAPEHVVTVEDDYELGLHLDSARHPVVSAWESRTAGAEGTGEITLDDLLKQALRHSPSRVVVGEVRAGEITALLRALGNGAAGGMGTLHATSARAVPDRIAALGQLANPPLPIHAAHRWTASALDLIVHVTRHDRPDGRRRSVGEIVEVGPVGDAETPDLTPIFATPTGQDQPTPIGPPAPHLLDRLTRAGLNPGVFDCAAPAWGGEHQ